jgi:hypothetical protein
MRSRVVAVSSSSTHSFSKNTGASITLLAGLGVQGDAHCGATVKRRSRVAQDATQLNSVRFTLLRILGAEKSNMSASVRILETRGTKRWPRP